MAYDKPWHSCEDMVVKLRERGLSITDEPKAISYLSRIGYYRLSGYWYAFRELSAPCCPLVKPKGKKDGAQRITLDQFVAGAKFEDAVHLYVFDKKLRLLVLDALERIEVAFRVEVAHLLGERTENVALFWPIPPCRSPLQQ